MFVEDLPVSLMVDILSRLPVRTIIHCKCVCKKWLDLILDSYFVNLHMSRSPTTLMIHLASGNERTGYRAGGILKWVEVEDELDHRHLHNDHGMRLDLNLAPTFQSSKSLPVGSVNGLICLWQHGFGNDNTYICNPITREYMILPRQQFYTDDMAILITYGFGVSSVTQEYKVIRIFQGDVPKDFTSTSPRLMEAEVYTLGTGRWRSLGRVPYRVSGIYGPFLNGHAHWIVVDEDSPEKLCVFDFDNETFELFPSPPSEDDIEECIEECLGVIKGCLCCCDTYLSNTYLSNGYLSKFTVWVMKEYGIKESWHRLLEIQQSISYDLDRTILEPLYIMDGINDGTIFTACYFDVLVVYAPQRKIIVDLKRFDCNFRGFGYRPSFHSLRNFENERVHVF